jgi:hypothetical protein
VGRDELVPDAREIEGALPGVLDAVSSPRRNLVIAVTYRAFVAFTVASGTIAGPPVAFPIPEDLQSPLVQGLAQLPDEFRRRLEEQYSGEARYPQIVTAEWAVGRRNVQRWTREVAELLAR